VKANTFNVRRQIEIDNEAARTREARAKKLGVDPRTISGHEAWGNRTGKKKNALPKSAKPQVSKLIAQEMRTGRPRAQAIAIGFSRARAAVKQSKLDKIVAKYS
jgi:hypothetical protein